MEGQKTHVREELLPIVEDQLKACKTAVKFLAEAAQFLQLALELQGSDNALITAQN